MSGRRPIEERLRHASELRHARRWAEAEAAYRDVLAERPELAESWYNLAFTQRMAGRYEAALESYAQALRRGVRAPWEAHLNRAVIFADHLRREASAEAELKAALALKADFWPALFNLANLREESGLRAEATALYERVLAHEPRAYEALARLGQLAQIERADDPTVVRLRAALADESASLEERASLGFALGRALDAAGDYDAAFSAIVAANAASREAEPAARYDRDAQERWVDALIAATPPARAGTGGEGARIFICGMFRSGSTLCEQVLAGHPHVTAGGELDLIARMAQRELRPFPAALSAATPQELERLARAYRETVAALHPGAQIVTDKRPDNIFYVGLIKALFPAAKIVLTRRHPLDNCLSVFFLHLDQSMAYALDLLDTAHQYRQQHRLAEHWRARYRGDVHTFDYDAFVRDPREETEKLLKFLGLGWSEDCLAFHRRDNAVKTASVWQVREPLYSRASGRWRHYAGHLSGVRAYLDDLIPEA